MSVAEFYNLEARKIVADGEKIQLFTSHAVTLGAFREGRLRQYLAEHVPGRLTVNSGFVTYHDRDAANIYDFSSRQVDCLIHDAGMHAPLLKTDEFDIVTPSAAAAFVEVKSDLTLHKSIPKNPAHGLFLGKKGRYRWSGTLVESLENIKAAIDVMEKAEVPRGVYFAGIMAYSASSINQYVNAMTCGELVRQLEITSLDQLPDCICIFQGSSYHFSFSAEPHPEVNGVGNTCPDSSYLLDYRPASQGSSLQIFTAFLNTAISVERLGNMHNVGGMRSGAGYDVPFEEHKIPVPSPRQHRTGVVHESL